MTAMTARASGMSSWGQRRKQKSKHDMSSRGSGHGSDEDASIDADMEEDEEKLYQQIIAAQGRGPRTELRLMT